MMKILISGSDHVWSIERYYKKYFAKNGAEVQLFAAQNIFYDFYKRSLINKILFRVGLSRIHKHINEKFLQVVDTFRPDVILVVKGMELFPKTLLKIKEKNILLANLNTDSPFIFSGKGSGNKNITDSIGLYDLHFTYDCSTEDTLHKVFNAVTETLPFGFEVSDSLVNNLKKETEILRLCFIGNADAERIKFLKELGNAGISLDVYGNGWKDLNNEKNISAHGPVYGDDFWKILYKYRVQLNLMRPHNPESHNMRSFEVPGVGGILLAPDTEDHKTYFEPGKEIFLYHDLNTCIKQIKYLLSLSKEDADKIRAAARKRSIESGYSYEGRAIQALNVFKKLQLAKA